MGPSLQTHGRLVAADPHVVAHRSVKRGAPSTPEDALAFVRACAAGDGAARRAFQDRFAADVYAFPVKVFGVPADRAAEFYLYAFDDDRIFTRLKSFEGRNAIQLRTFLAYYVLRGLFLDWQRGQRELDTVPLESSQAAGDARPWSERLAARDPAQDAPAPAAGPTAALWGALAPEERLDLKLLSLLEHDLEPDDLRLLARIAGRPLAETRALVEDLQADLCARDEGLAALRAELDQAWGWIVLRRRELAEVDEELRFLGPVQTPAAERLRRKRRTLDAAIARRLRQRERILGEMRRFKVTTPYKDIARLKGSTVGTVCSRIFRLRERLEARWRAVEETP